MAQVHVLTGVERRRRWSTDQKRAIIAAAFAPGAVVTDVARRSDVNSGQIYRWRAELGGGRDCQGSGAGFLPVVVTPDPRTVTATAPPMIEIDFSVSVAGASPILLNFYARGYADDFRHEARG